jgi:hypothetical protein
MRYGNALKKSALHQSVALFTVTLGLALLVTISAGGQAAGHMREPIYVAAAGSFPNSSPTPTIGLNVGFAMADFTGDTHPDLATVEFNGFDSARAQYVIEVRLSEGGHQFLQLTAPFGGLLITPKDVTGDGNLDLVVRIAKSETLVAVFLNDGSGHFSPAVEPASFARALPEAPSELEFTAEQIGFGAMVVSPGSCAAECHAGSARNPQGQGVSLLSANYGAPSHSVLPFGLNRAPPTVV